MAGARTVIDVSGGRLAQRWQRFPHRLRIIVPGILLIAGYALLTLVIPTDAFLSPDVGGKVATLKVMAANHTVTNVDVGYWAARWDPQGLLHPLYQTRLAGGHWVQVTSLPLILLSAPLYQAGGYRLTLALPISGAVACAFAARAMVKRCGGDQKRGWWAFWIIGLASPVTMYAMSFWEHTIGLALMAWGLIALLDLLDTDTTRRRVVLSGLGGFAFGLATTMRTEALVYLAVAGTVVALTIVKRDRRIVAWIAPAFALAAGAAFPVLADAMLSRHLVGADARTGRTASAASGIGADPLQRLRNGLGTTFGLTADSRIAAIAAGVVIAGLIGFVAWRGRNRPGTPGDRRVVPVLVVVAACYLAIVLNGLGYIPGIVGTAPIAVVGAVVVWRRPRRRASMIAMTVALGSLPLIWAVQWTPGAFTQWGSRYSLLTMFVLVTLGVTTFGALKKPIPQVLTACSAAITIFGFAFLHSRASQITQGFEHLRQVEAPVLVADSGLTFYPREGGAFYGQQRWLITPASGDLGRAARVVREAGFTTFALISYPEDASPKQIGGFHGVAARPLDPTRADSFVVTTYRLAPSTR